MKKKILISTILILIAGVLIVYLWYPQRLILNKEKEILIPQIAFVRITSNTNNWKKWWPENGKQIASNAFEFNNCTFTVAPSDIFSISIKIEFEDFAIQSGLYSTQIGNDKLLIRWSGEEKNSNSPIERISTYRQFKHIEKTVDLIIKQMGQNMMDNKKIYGLQIERKNSPDSCLITYKQNVNHYPTVQDIYQNIDLLEKYTWQNNATTTNYPMLNIKKSDSNKYEFMVALPITKFLPNKGNIIAKQMFAKGYFLISDDVHGGFAKVDSLLQELENFKTDYSLVSPAIPFQSLITNRIKQPDSVRWVTRLYYPVY